MGFFKEVGKLFTGTPAKRENVSTLRPEQEDLYNQLIGAGKGQGAGGAFGTAADYYRNLLSDNPSDFQAFAKPELRRFNEQILPDISEEFAGMGAGGLSSSGFQNAAVGAGTDLSERLGAIRANLRQSGAQGLQNIGQAGLQNYSQNMETQAGTPGLLSQVAPAIGSAITSFGSNWLSDKYGAGSKGTPAVGKNSSPYGSSIQTSSKAAVPSSSNGFNLPGRKF